MDCSQEVLIACLVGTKVYETRCYDVRQVIGMQWLELPLPTRGNKALGFPLGWCHDTDSAAVVLLHVTEMLIVGGPISVENHSLVCSVQPI